MGAVGYKTKLYNKISKKEHPFFSNNKKMPVPAGAVGGGGQPTCLQRIQLGFMMGCCVGVASGIIFGGFQGWRMGFRGRELVHQLGKTMAQSGGTFGTFMAIGTGVRC